LTRRFNRAGPREIDLSPVEPAASPLSVRTANLDRVVVALETAGVPYFRVPPLQRQSSVLGVAESHRPLAGRALAGLAADGATVCPLPDGVTAVYWPIADPGRNLLFGADQACEVEFWREESDRLVAPRFNLSTDVLMHTDAEVEAGESAFGDFHTAVGDDRRYRTRQPFLLPALDHIDFPVDVVYTWVDGGDPAWVTRKNAALAENGWVTGNEEAANASRYLSRDELRYSLRSLHAYAPWVRRIFLVTDDQVPAWLNTEHPQITVLSHKEIFAGVGKLPTFNSMAIETRLHHINGLAEHFIYINDDVFFGQALEPGFFFTAAGQTRVYLSKVRVDNGPVTADEPPVMSAGKNNRAVIEKEFGRYLAFKIKHTPHAARRSVLAEIEEKHPELLALTASHQFRHPDDISLTSSLQQHWAYLTGRAVLGEVQYMYRDLSDPLTPKRLANALRKRHHQLFCLNDTKSGEVPAEAQAAMLDDFLSAYYPFPSPYERPDQGV
jgi:hypothetical protein